MIAGDCSSCERRGGRGELGVQSSALAGQGFDMECWPNMNSGLEGLGMGMARVGVAALVVVHMRLYSHVQAETRSNP
jgi:hypothetical protein